MWSNSQSSDTRTLVRFQRRLPAQVLCGRSSQTGHADQATGNHAWTLEAARVKRSAEHVMETKTVWRIRETTLEVVA